MEYNTLIGEDMENAEVQNCKNFKTNVAELHKSSGFRSQYVGICALHQCTFVWHMTLILLKVQLTIL